MSEHDLRCVICDGDMLFEVPLICADEHDECPELICNRCGAAEVVAPIVVHVWLNPQGRRSGRVAPQQRRAA